MSTPYFTWNRPWPAGLLLLLACTEKTSPRDEFARHVAPVLERSCSASACHGVPPDAEARGERIDWGQFFVRTDPAGRLIDINQAYRAAKRVINTLENPGTSSILRKPLAVPAGGIGHLGGGTFASREDPGYRALASWIGREEQGGEDPKPLTESELLFADTVQPVLRASTCMTARCHGPAAGAIPYALDPGENGSWSISATRHNYEQTLRVVTLDGYPQQSRLIRKAQPLGPGIVHKGLNFDFFAGDPGDGLSALTKWICHERLARGGHECAAADGAPMTAFVYLRGPVAPHHAFELDEYTPGSDLFLAAIDEDSMQVRSRVNLTDALHPSGLADVRDPAVSRDGAQVVFSMRTSLDEGHHLWLLDLRTRRARQLTFDNARLPGSGMATDRDPTFGPNGTIWFVSTRPGKVADQGRFLDAEVYSVDPDSMELRRWTYTPHVERKPVFFDIGEEAGGEVGFSALRDAIPSQARAHIFRFPPSGSTEYHQHFGVTTKEDLVYDMRELPDGRYVSVVGRLPGTWEAGALGISERNFGPILRDAEDAIEPSMERYEPPLVVLRGEGAYRDPSVLPDGRILVAHQTDMLDANDPSATFTPRIELIELDESADGTGSRIARSTVLVEESGVALTDPEPVTLRAPVQVHEAPLPLTDDVRGVLRHQGMPLIDALLSNLSPSGSKVRLEGIKFVRLIEDLPRTPIERTARIDLGGTASTTGLSVHGPARVLAELPVAEDGSFQASVPANVAFRIQALDDQRMTIGTMHNRWFYALPGQTVTLGIASTPHEARYGARCAACHGDAEGSDLPPEQEPPDTLTGASLSLARFQKQHPRHPIEPLALGEATRIEVDFRTNVQPILSRSCVRCHDDRGVPQGLDLRGNATQDFTASYESLLRSGVGSGNGRAWVDDGDGRARTSHLVERLLGRELAAPKELPMSAGPHPAPVGSGDGLSDEELMTIVRWIELGATFEGTAVPREAR